MTDRSFSRNAMAAQHGVPADRFAREIVRILGASCAALAAAELFQ